MPLWYLEERLAIFVTKDGCNSIDCNGCKYWVRQKCSNLKGRLRDNKNYWYRKYAGETGVHDNPQVEHIIVDGAALEIVDKFCYLGNKISTGGGAEESVIARTRSRWKS